MAISFFLIQRADALEFSLEAPEQVETRQEFDARIISDTTDIYDVKIFVHQGDKNKPVSEIYDGTAWKKPRLYLRGVFPAQSSFRLRVLSFIGASEVCARMRKANATAFSEQCKAISVSENNNLPSNQSVSEDEQNITEDNTKTAKKKPSNQKSFVPLNEPSEPELKEEDNDKKKIVLSSKKESGLASQSEVYITPEGKIRQAVIYAFAGFCILLVILIAFKKV